MQNELDSKLVMLAFEKIRQHGQKIEDAYLLDGLKAYSDFDGYTLYIEDAYVSLSFGFHNQYHLHYDNKEQVESFIKGLKKVVEGY